jgi:hypothetical protein
MKPNFTLKKKTADVYAFSILLLALSLLLSLINIYNRPSGDLFVSVYIENQLVNQYSLYEKQTLTFEQTTYPILLGDIVLAIEDQRIRIEQETSPLNVCSEQGWVATPGLPLICAPNYFMAVIEAPIL